MHFVDAAALLSLACAIALSLAAHWHLGTNIPLFGARSVVQAALSAHYAAPSSDVDVLQSGAGFWDGSASSAPFHEALGRAYASVGREDEALAQFQRTATSRIPAPLERPWEEKLGVRAKLNAAVEEARIRLRQGQLNEALDVVSGTIATSAVGVSDIRAHALHVLVSSVLISSPSEAEAAGVTTLLRDCLRGLTHADVASRAQLHEELHITTTAADPGFSIAC